MKHFPPFRFDAPSGLLWHGLRQIPLTRKAALLLDCLISHPGILVSHEQIMREVWPDAHVQQENVKVLVHELRTSMGDSAHAPLFIRSHPGRGYTFLASVTDAPPPFGSTASETRASAIVGRRVELRTMIACLTSVVDTAQSQIILVEGERGLGKTALCNAFVSHATSQMVLRVSRAEGHESAATDGAPPLVIDALSLLADQYPLLVTPAVLDRVCSPQDHFPRSSLFGLRQGTEPMRPFRTSVRTGSDLAVVLESLTREVPLLLIFEDLQWTDKVTLACLDAVARRHPGAPLCIVGSYSRTANVETGRALERLGRDIRAQHRGIVIRLTALTFGDVDAMVSRALGPRAAAATADAVFDVTGGHPAQVARAISALGEMAPTPSASGDEWIGDHLSLAISTMAAEGVQYQIDELGTDDRIVLETAAVIGSSFTAAEVAAALDLKHVSPIVRRLEGLAAGGMLIEADPVGASADADSRYRFRAPRAVDLLAAPIPISRCTRITSRARRAARLYARSS